MLLGSLVELHVWLHSYMCFSLLEKRFLSNLNTSSISPHHLAFCRALKVFSYRNLDRFSTAGGSIEFLFLCLCFVSQHLYLSTLFFSTPTLTDGSTPFDTSICQELIRSYIFSLRDPVITSSISLDLSASIPLPNTMSLTPNLFPSDFSSFFKFSFTW